ncbi:hypothetical protein TTHERM_00713340 (macronuclear) [Tetrahymena thermophila SB210]|uniref:Uncharacterized protein n=1 Tax=Tetrahymena thermophila (strain SB210) TaxID=312017 RepID=Q24CW7_TETTS|nr:hypothetical protein TTHERM_00713340 [Tetrahymena thermophila SB210]EAS05641.1 hypothetical protein TTHERM_00713340 [Tetrahymena thermophila SB210]|eukprot:XP_001025886.1 hypothetical protein TTHERM_00713340 [Tetrahymena thermophila SB210]
MNQYLSVAFNVNPYIKLQAQNHSLKLIQFPLSSSRFSHPLLDSYYSLFY